jgi:MarR family transcriptional regulator, organic hydroperoxide resistance regulator
MAATAPKRSRRPDSDVLARSVRPPVTTARAELTGDGTGERFRHFVNDLLTIAVRMDAVRERFAQLVGVTAPQYTVLVTVAQLEGAAHPAAPDGATVRAVAEHMHVSGAFVTAETGKLAKRGFLAKRPNPADGRSVLLSLTPKGRKALDAALPQIRAVNDVFFGKLGADEFERVAAGAARIVEASPAAVLLAHSLSAGARKS